MRLRKLIGAMILIPMLGSCSTPLGNMKEGEFRELLVSVKNLAYTGGTTLRAELTSEEQGVAYNIAVILAQTIINDNLASTDDAVNFIIWQLREQINNDGIVHLLSDAANLLDATVGQVKIGIDGLLSIRQKLLLVAMLEGFAKGVAGQPI
jgi:hypothetical protein